MSRINIGKVAPIPKGDWVQSQPYEKLNMVSKSGVLYIAKQDVPANTAITNIDYWMPANGQLSIGTVETVSASTGASATITDGSNGPELNLSIPRGVTGNESIDDTKGKGDTDYVWSADKNYEEITNKAPVILSNASGSIASFSDGSASPVTALSVNIDPVQDLHGYDNPWPAGGGKNLLPLTVSEIKSLNTAGTWNGNAYTYRGITYTILFDSADNVVGINLNGTSTADWANFTLPNFSLSAGNYKLNGSTDGSSSTYRIAVKPSGGSDIAQYSSEVPITIDSDKSFTGYITVRTSGTTVSNVKIYPMIRLASITDATFAPYENICPISGHTSATVTRTGKNLGYLSTANIYSEQYDSKTFQNGGVVVSATASYGRVGFTIPVMVGQTYNCSFKAKKTGTVYDIQIGANSTWNTYTYKRITDSQMSTSFVLYTTSFTATTDTLYFRVYVNTNGSEIAVEDFQLELGSTASAYEPYQGTSVTIDLDGTRYGGTVNLLTGEMTVDRASVTIDGSEGWSKSSITDCDIYMNASSRYGDLQYETLLSHFKFVQGSSTVNTVGCAWKGSSNTQLRIGFSAYGTTTVTDFINWLSENPVQIVTHLATPLTVQLTPNQLTTLLGQNNIWTDTGDIAVEYRADTKLYIQKLTQPTEDDMIANNNIESNKFFMLGNSLYYSTTAIAVGTSIIPGNNCTKLSLADALNNLNS